MLPSNLARNLTDNAIRMRLPFVRKQIEEKIKTAAGNGLTSVDLREFKRCVWVDLRDMARVLREHGYRVTLRRFPTFRFAVCW
jgi:hypothetical protein